MQMTVFRHMALAATLVVSAPAFAQGFQNVDQLERDLVAALGAGVGDPGGPMAPVDRRLKLAQCPGNLVFDAPVMGAVAVRCPTLGWRIRVPLIRSATQANAAVAVERQEPVIRRGDPVEIVAGGPFFQVSTQAVAEQDGAPGARIRVRSAPKSPPIVAEVVKTGIVRIPD